MTRHDDRDRDLGRAFEESGESPLRRQLEHWDPASRLAPLDQDEKAATVVRALAALPRRDAASAGRGGVDGRWGAQRTLAGAVLAALLVVLVAGGIWASRISTSRRAASATVAAQALVTSPPPALPAVHAAPVPASVAPDAAGGRAVQVAIREAERTATTERAVTTERVAALERGAASVPGDAVGVPGVHDVDDPREIAGAGAARRIRRLAFEAPSGTRIYWTFDSDFAGMGGRDDDRSDR